MKIENLTFGYDNKLIFNNFNIEFENGKITALLGRSGVGKTTLLNLISGIIPSKYQVKTSVAIAFQDDKLIPHLSVKENLSLVGINTCDIENALKEFDMIDKLNAYPNKLSGGEKQRVNILRAFLSNKELILLDEPFSSLDINLKLKLIKMTAKLYEENNSTVIFVTHDIEEALMLSNRIVVLGDNKINLEMHLDGAPTQRNYGENASERQKILSALT